MNHVEVTVEQGCLWSIINNRRTPLLIAHHSQNGFLPKWKHIWLSFLKMLILSSVTVCTNLNQIEYIEYILNYLDVSFFGHQAKERINHVFYINRNLILKAPMFYFSFFGGELANSCWLSWNRQTASVLILDSDFSSSNFFHVIGAVLKKWKEKFFGEHVTNLPKPSGDHSGMKYA